MRISVNKAVSRGSGNWRCRGGLLLSVHHGGEREEGWPPARRWLPHPQQGSSSASTRRLFTVPLSLYPMAGRQPLHRRITTAPLSPYFMAEGRPHHPRVTATGRPHGNNNLRQAFMPTRRLSSFVGVSSHLCAPSGPVPGGVEVDSGELRRGEEEVGPARVSLFYSRVLSAICKGQVVICLFFFRPFCKMYSTAQGMKP
jgi:hypothetical protein